MIKTGRVDPFDDNDRIDNNNHNNNNQDSRIMNIISSADNNNNNNLDDNNSWFGDTSMLSETIGNILSTIHTIIHEYHHIIL